MNILFLYGSMRKGGAERVIASLSNLLVGMGDTVNIAVLDNAEPCYPLDERVGLIRFNIARESKNAAEANVNLWRKLRAIRGAERDLAPDILVAFDPQLAVLAKLAVKRAKVVGSERSNPYLARRGMRKKFFVKLAPIADGFVFQTQGASGFYPRAIRKKAAVIPNGVFLQLPEVLPKYAEREKSICATGSLRQVKRYDLLIDAFAKLREAVSDYTLHIYGDGALRESLAEQITRLGLDECVILEGNCADVGAALANHRIFVLASDHEGMPNGLIEAMACGCACVSTDCDFGPNELISDGENGILTPVGDAEKLAETLERIVLDDALGDRLAQSAREISQTLSPEQIAKRFRDYFESIIKKP